MGNPGIQPLDMTAERRVGVLAARLPFPEGDAAGGLTLRASGA